MADKTNRDMGKSANAQNKAEEVNDKFRKAMQPKADSIDTTDSHAAKRKSPQISCKVTQENYDFLHAQIPIAAAKRLKGTNISHVIDALIRLGKENPDKLKY